MKAGRVFAATAMIGFLAACSLVPVEGITERPYESDHFTAELSKVGALQPEGSAFTQGLYSGYSARAKMEANELDYPSANRFLGKARLARNVAVSTTCYPISVVESATPTGVLSGDCRGP